MHVRKIDLYRRQIREGGAKIAEFLIMHPDIDPEFIDDMTDDQEAELRQYISDLMITWAIERNELDVEQ